MIRNVSMSAIVLLTASMIGCLGDSTKPKIDGKPPVQVADLAVSNLGSEGIRLTWTAPRDRGPCGRVAAYDIRYSLTAIGEETWDAAHQVDGEPSPGPPGGLEGFTVGGLMPSTTYHFALRAADDAQNWSGVSNEATVTTTYGARTSILSVIHDLAQAYQDRNRDEYGKLFDDQFTFIFDPFDAEKYWIPDSWGLADELLSAQHLFGFGAQPNRDGYRAESIELQFRAGPEESTDLNPAWKKVTLSEVYLTVGSRHKDTGDPMTYRVEGDMAHLYFVETDEFDAGNGLKIWKIVRWDDKPKGHASLRVTQTTTWGQIKAAWL